MFERKNMNAVGKSPIVNCVGKARHGVAPYVFLDDSPTFRSVEDHRDCPVCGLKKLDRLAFRRGVRNIALPQLVPLRRWGGISVAFERAPRRLHDFFMGATSYAA